MMNMLQKQYLSLGLFNLILVSGLISAVIANKLPGNGSIYLKQEQILKNRCLLEIKL